MAHPSILSVRLLPPDIPHYCRECNKHSATHWLVCPDGNAISTICEKHGVETIFQFRRADLLGWRLEPLFHENKADRTSHARPPICGHSICGQLFIDTGENACVCCNRCGTAFVDRGGPSLECDCGLKVQA